MERRRLYNWLNTLSVVMRLGLGCLFLWSSLSKIQLPHDFLGHVYAYRLVGPVSGMLVGMVLPWLELLVGACLLGGVFVGGALLASLGMGMLFTFVLGSALWRHLDISCGCFSSSAAGQISYMTLIRAVAITLFSAGAYGATILVPPREWRSAPVRPKPEDDRRLQFVPKDGALPLPQE